MRYILCALLTLSFIAPLGEASPRYIFLFIGDGLSEGQIEIFEHLARQDGRNTLFLRFPVHVSLENRTLGGAIPDSASAATSIACGVKVSQGVISQDSKGRPLKTIAEEFRERGWSVGIVTNVAVNDATPSAFYAHAASRRDYDTIARQIPQSGFDLFVGNGIATSGKTMKEAILESAQRTGYRVITRLSDLSALPTLALLPFTFAIDRKDDTLTLSRVTKRAIELLAGSEEFFLLVEGGRIDWCNHMNDAASSLAELEDFEGAIAEALLFLEHHSEETLVIVTADHGTGGMQKSTRQPLQKPFQTSSYERFLHQLETAPKDEKALLNLCSLTWGKDPSFFARDTVCRQVLQEFFFHQDEKNLWMQLTRRMNEEWGIAWTTTGHTGEYVPLFVWGEGAERFCEAQKNIDIARILKNLLEECVVQEEHF